jgi:hypothetical protein
MKIAVIGAGNVGATLGEKFAAAGHEVVFGVRKPDGPHDTFDGARFSSIGAAAAEAEAIVLAIPFGAAVQAIRDCGDLAGKIIVDATNPLTMTAEGLALTCGFDTSGAEQIAAEFPHARFVKAFNTTGYGNMADPAQSMMPVCGNDPDAVEKIRSLAEDIGFDAIAIGDLKKARLLEPLAMFWIHLAYSTDLSRDFAFRIVRR